MDERWTNHVLLKEPFGSMLLAEVHVFSDSVTLLHRSHDIRFSQCFTNREQKADAVMKSHNGTNRNDFAGQSIDIEWHVCPGDTSVQILHKLQEFMLETRHAPPESFPDRTIFASMFNDINSWEIQKVHNKCLAQANDVATYSARFRPGYWCFCGPGEEKTWTYNEGRPSHQVFRWVRGTSSYSKMEGPPSDRLQ